jgi:SAM-dependent methyltransferase
MLEKIRYFLSPLFLEKKSILKTIKLTTKEQRELFINKKILDIGCGSKPYSKLFENLGADYKGIDFEKYSLNKTFDKSCPDYFFPKDYSTKFIISNLKNNSFDSIVSFQVLEHHEKPEILFSEVNRLLKKRGYFFLTFPFIWCLHEEPFDYQRLTHYKILNLAKENGFKVIKIVKRGGALSSVSQILNTSLFNTKINKIFKWAIYLFLLPLQYLVYLIEKLQGEDKEKSAFLGYAILLRKK